MIELREYYPRHSSNPVRYIGNWVNWWQRCVNKSLCTWEDYLNIFNDINNMTTRWATYNICYSLCLDQRFESLFLSSTMSSSKNWEGSVKVQYLRSYTICHGSLSTTNTSAWSDDQDRKRFLFSVVITKIWKMWMPDLHVTDITTSDY